MITIRDAKKYIAIAIIFYCPIQLFIIAPEIIAITIIILLSEK
jgi:hypothetical protein